MVDSDDNSSSETEEDKKPPIPSGGDNSLAIFCPNLVLKVLCHFEALIPLQNRYLW